MVDLKSALSLESGVEGYFMFYTAWFTMFAMFLQLAKFNRLVKDVDIKIKQYVRVIADGG